MLEGNGLPNKIYDAQIEILEVGENVHILQDHQTLHTLLNLTRYKRPHESDS